MARLHHKPEASAQENPRKAQKACLVEKRSRQNDMTVKIDSHEQARLLYQELQAKLTSKGYHCDYKFKPKSVKGYEPADCFAICEISEDPEKHTIIGKAALYENKQFGLLIIHPECSCSLHLLNSALGNALELRVGAIQAEKGPRTRFDVLPDPPDYFPEE